MTLLLAILLAIAPGLADAKAETHPGKRSDLALANASRALDAARSAYSAGDIKKTEAEVGEVQESVDLSYNSLESSHKRAGRDKYFKRAEIKLREMVRRLTAFRDSMSVDDRPRVQNAIKRLQKVHDSLLTEIMTER